jgi:hypothetical protein
MLGADHCLARAERMRMRLLVGTDPASAVRLRRLIQRYRKMADKPRHPSLVATMLSEVRDYRRP